jgi:hypothetical protein
LHTFISVVCFLLGPAHIALRPLVILARRRQYETLLSTSNNIPHIENTRKRSLIFPTPRRLSHRLPPHFLKLALTRLRQDIAHLWPRIHISPLGNPFHQQFQLVSVARSAGTVVDDNVVCLDVLAARDLALCNGIGRSVPVLTWNEWQFVWWKFTLTKARA